jgi:hypothetical protein
MNMPDWVQKLLTNGVGVALAGVGLAILVGLASGTIGTQLQEAEFMTVMACSIVVALIGAAVEVYVWKRRYNVYQAQVFTDLWVQQVQVNESEKRLTAAQMHDVLALQLRLQKLPPEEPVAPGASPADLRPKPPPAPGASPATTR